MSASIDDITAGLTDLVETAKYKDKRTQLNGGGFTTLVSDLNVYLEKKGKTTVATADHTNVARVIWYTKRLKERFQEVNAKYGTFATADLVPLVAVVQAGPKYTDLNTPFNASASPDVRRDVARVLGIEDKHHNTHGSNFSGTQTLRQIIADVVSKVTGQQEQNRVRGLLRKLYPGYQ